MTLGKALLLLFLGLLADRGLQPLFALQPAAGIAVSPMWTLLAAVWIAIRSRGHVSAAGSALSNHAQLRGESVLTLALIAGLILDSLAARGVLGPIAVGLVAGVAAVLAARRIVDVRSAVALALLVTLAGFTATILTTAAFAGRSLLNLAETSVGSGQLLAGGLLSTLYTALIACLLRLPFQFRR